MVRHLKKLLEPGEIDQVPGVAAATLDLIRWSVKVCKYGVRGIHVAARDGYGSLSKLRISACIRCLSERFESIWLRPLQISGNVRSGLVAAPVIIAVDRLWSLSSNQARTV